MFGMCFSVCRYSPDAGVEFTCSIFLIYSCANAYLRNTELPLFTDSAL